MIRKLKALGIGLIAVLAISAVAASGASAQHFTSEVPHTLLEGAQAETLVFTIPAGATSCKKATFAGTTSAATVTEITVFGQYGECTSFGEPMTVKMNSCDYLLTANKAAAEHNTAHVKCTGAPIETIGKILGSTCTTTIGQHTPTAGGFVYETGGAGSTHDLVINATVEGISWTMDGPAFPCKLSGGSGNNATLKGKITVRGYDTTGSQVGITAT